MIFCDDADDVCFSLGWEVHGAASSTAPALNLCIITSSTTAILCSLHSNFSAISVVEIKSSEECDVSVVIVCEDPDPDTPGFCSWAPEGIDDNDNPRALIVAISMVFFCCCISFEDSRATSSCSFVCTFRCLGTSMS